MARTDQLTKLSRRARSLTGRLVLVGLGIHALVIPVVFTGLFRIVRDGYQSSFVDMVRGDAHNFATILSRERDHERVVALLDDAMLSGRIVSVRLRRGEELLQPSLTAGPAGNRFSEDFFFGQNGDSVYHIAVPLPGTGPAAEAMVYLGYDEQPTVEQVHLAYQRILYVACAYVALTLLAVAMLGPRLTRSLRRLSETSRRVAAGETSLAFAVETRISDVAELAANLEWMRREILAKTEELAAHEALTRLIVETAADGIITIDSQGVIESCNRATEQIFGYSENEMIGHNISLLMPSPYREEHDGYIQTYLRTGQAKVLGRNRETEALRKDGKVISIRVAISEFRLQGKRSFTGIVQDISQRKEVEALKSEFLNSVSHEIRTPLNAIVSSAKILLKYGDKKPDTTERFGSILVDEAKRLTRLVNDMLDLSKMEAGKMEWDLLAVPPGKVIERVAFLAEASAREKNVTFATDVAPGLPDVHADLDKIIQVLTNLINNALKFTPAGGSITVRVQQQDRKYIQFGVEDSGEGIPPQDQPKVFEKFKQLGAGQKNRPKGTGLGLPICKEIIAAHGGKIWLESEAGVGSTFFFTLAISQPVADYRGSTSMQENA